MKKNRIIKNLNFYFIKSSFDLIISKLCYTLLKKKYKILIKMNSQKESTRIDDFLWTYDKHSFLPHSTENDGYVKQEKILITHDEILNKTFTPKFDILVISPNVVIKKLKNFENFFFFSYDFDLIKNINFKILKDKGFMTKAFKENEQFKWESI